jgi:hypothetical protein
MKSVRERMDINAVYREVGTFRATAAICGTTAKTVKRAVTAQERRAEGGTVEVAHNYDCVADLVAERVARTRGGSRQSGCWWWPARRAMRDRRGTSAAW